jgi:NADPH:quinone reductase-like Zn-dependent oxidoreductase
MQYLAPSTCCLKIPDWLSFEDAAAIPTSFVTALYALTTPARVSIGQVRIAISLTLGLSVH